jgi:probable F420-dependent oxidoreductase
MKVGLCLPTYDQYGDPKVLRELIQAAEAMGYASVWFGDHIVVPDYAKDRTGPHWYDAIATACVGIGLTRRLTFGTDVLVTPYRDPILLAKMAATASELSGGRLALGMGVGFLKGEFEALGVPPFERRGAVTDEYLAVMRLLFEAKPETPLAFEGEWVRFRDICFGPVPAAPPPLLVGGNHAKALDRAARLGDGWHPLWPTPEAYAEGRRRILAARERERVTRPFTFSFSCPYTRLLAEGEHITPMTPKAAEAGVEDYGYIPTLPTAPDGRTRFIGTAAQMQEDLAAYAAAGVEQVVLRFALPWDADVPPPRFIQAMQAFATDVLPACRTL